MVRSRVVLPAPLGPTARPPRPPRSEPSCPGAARRARCAPPRRGSRRAQPAVSESDEDSKGNQEQEKAQDERALGMIALKEEVNGKRPRLRDTGKDAGGGH